MKSKPSRILMIRPHSFGFNAETADSNSFQKNNSNLHPGQIQHEALKEFDVFAEKLRHAGIDVLVIDDNPEPHTPDSIFPNNWISFHEEGIMVLYPMLAENRRKERRKDIIEKVQPEGSSVIDLSFFEHQHKYLEGTGSIVFDYENKTAYANISPRTNRHLLIELCGRLDYKAVTFHAHDEAGEDIYHTNVLMCIGQGFAILCDECITDEKERQQVISSLERTGREIITISKAQMASFAGNMYQLFNNKSESIIVMSEQAYKALDAFQVVRLEKYGKILHSPLYTIEKHGGGSARCMIADIRK
jgi:hypothetical protein